MNSLIILTNNRALFRERDYGIHFNGWVIKIKWNNDSIHDRICTCDTTRQAYPSDFGSIGPYFHTPYVEPVVSRFFAFLNNKILVG